MIISATIILGFVCLYAACMMWAIGPMLASGKDLSDITSKDDMAVGPWPWRKTTKTGLNVSEFMKDHDAMLRGSMPYDEYEKKYRKGPIS